MPHSVEDSVSKTKVYTDRRLLEHCCRLARPGLCTAGFEALHSVLLSLVPSPSGKHRGAVYVEWEDGTKAYELWVEPRWTPSSVTHPPFSFPRAAEMKFQTFLVFCQSTLSPESPKISLCSCLWRRMFRRKNRFWKDLRNWSSAPHNCVICPRNESLVVGGEAKVFFTEAQWRSSDASDCSRLFNRIKKKKFFF